MAQYIYKLAQQTPNEGILALQKGMAEFIALMQEGIQQAPDQDKVGLFAYVKQYLSNIKSTYSGEVNKFDGMLSQYVKDNAYVLSKVANKLATTNLSDALKAQYGTQAWFAQIVYFGENVKKIFGPLDVALAGVIDDVASESGGAKTLPQHGAALGKQLSETAEQFSELCKSYRRAAETKNPIQAARLEALTKAAAKLI